MRRRVVERVATLAATICLATVVSATTARADEPAQPVAVVDAPDSALVADLSELAARCAAGTEATCAAAATLARAVVATMGGCVTGVLVEAGLDEAVQDSPLVGPDTLGCAEVVVQAREAGQALRLFVNRCLDGADATCATVVDTVQSAAALVQACAAAAVSATVGIVLPAPPDSLQCGATVTFVRDELLYVATLLGGLATGCVERSQPLCESGLQAVELVQDRAEGCLEGALAATGTETSLAITGTDPGCGGAVNTLASLAATLIALADGCLSGADGAGAACSDVRTLVTGVGSAVENCTNLSTGSPCRTALDSVTSASALAQAAVAACLAGAQAQCATAQALVDDVAHCSEITQVVGLCVGYYTTDDEQDPVVAAIAGALSAGGVPGAYLFVQGARQSLDAAQTALVDVALDAEAEEVGSGAALLYGAAGLTLPGDDAVPLPDSAEADRYTPKEAKHGHRCATAPQRWEWRGRDVNWGYCQTNNWGYPYCESLGHFWADVHSNIDFFPDVLWSHDFWHKDGHRAHFRNMAVRMKQDIANKADPTKAKYACSGGSVTLSCAQNRQSPSVDGRYYYVELNADVTCDCGKPPVHMQVQTRRWYVWSGGYPYYPAYDNGG